MVPLEALPLWAAVKTTSEVLPREPGLHRPCLSSRTNSSPGAGGVEARPAQGAGGDRSGALVTDQNAEAGVAVPVTLNSNWVAVSSSV